MPMVGKTKKLVIVGDSAFAEVAYEYFTHDSPYQVAGFSVESAFLRRDELFGLPIVPLETLESRFAPDEHEVYVAIVYTKLNRLRTRLCAAAKARGYRLASYISSRAFVWPNVEMGEHCFVFEDNTVQPFARLGGNVVLWSGNHVGHHTVIQDNCFISSHVVISGFCNIGKNCFMGVNSTVSNNVNIGDDNWIGPGVVIAKNTEPNKLFNGEQPEPSKVSSTRFFRVKS
jgi:sugar O-acyltransferase (sialic acid O-acetyltransferase NeuD family)